LVFYQKFFEEIIMQKKTLFILLAMLAISMPAMSIELPAGATPTFSKASTAYASAYEFNSIMEAYGLKLAPEAVAGVPNSYAKVNGIKLLSITILLPILLPNITVSLPLMVLCLPRKQ
jgi:hypothetical protein